MTPASTKNSCFTSLSAAPNAFKHANFAAALQNGHHQRVDDAQGGDRQRQAAEDCQQQVKHAEKNRQTLEASSNENAPKPRFLIFDSVASTNDGLFTRTVKLAYAGLSEDEEPRKTSRRSLTCAARKVSATVSGISNRPLPKPPKPEAGSVSTTPIIRRCFFFRHDA